MILVTGVTGKTGGEVARQLTAANLPFRAVVRNPDKADGIAGPGVDIALGDIADADFLRQALAGIDKALLVMPNDEHQLRLEKQFTDIAVESGVKHLLYLSSIESVPESTNPITMSHVAAENHIRAANLAWTMLRPTFFMQIFSGSAPKIKASGEIKMPGGNGTIATTDLRDVAEIIVKVFTEPGHENQSYDLTGPDLLTFAQIAERFSAVLGTPIQYVDQPMDEFRKILQSVGLGEWRVNAVCKEFEAIAGGAIDHTTDTIQQLLGRPPCSLDQFIADHAALFK
jgi:uncharacterized protein YbjT (DUF2867 family)